MIYELRIYHIHPGKMQAIHDRFSNATLGLFARHGLHVTDFWEDSDPESHRIYYIIEAPDRETLDARFDQFRNDPEWQRVKDESEQNGPIVEKVESIFLKRVPYFTKK